MKGKRRATKLVERRGEVIKIICSLKTYFIDFSFICQFLKIILGKNIKIIVRTQFGS